MTDVSVGYRRVPFDKLWACTERQATQEYLRRDISRNCTSFTSAPHGMNRARRFGPRAQSSSLISKALYGYADWIRNLHPNTEGKAVDIVAHFFRRALVLLREGGCFGLIATNSIAQGDTREAGLKQICKSKGQIYGATRRLRWPGEAAVIVSVVHIAKGLRLDAVSLDGRPVSALNSYLFPSATDFDPVPLAANADSCFQGASILGMGFTFDDTDPTGAASPISVMRDLLDRDQRNRERVFPYIGGEELNSGPRHSHHRYVIDFGDMSLEQASQWPDLIEIVRARVKPTRDEMGGYSVAERRKEYWWQFGTSTPALNRAKSELERVLAISRIGQQLAFTFLPSSFVFADSMVVFCFPSSSAFCALQSRLHELWARFFSSSMKDDLRYTPKDCFETFPFPEQFELNSTMLTVGQEYFDFRAALMIRNNEGLTKTYNRFHDPNELSADIVSLRELHDAMDRAVLDAYGWQDIQPACEFFPEFDDEEEDDDNGRPKRKKFRYRWPEALHDDVLARLLDLNRQRAQEEGQVDPATVAAAIEAASQKKAAKKSALKKPKDTSTQTMFAMGEGEA